jgi:DNA polymerase-1
MFLYGMLARKFVDYAYNSYNTIFTLREAELFREAFFNKYARLLPWHKEMEYRCEMNGGVANLFGRFRKLPNIYSENRFERLSAVRRAINTPVQGTGSDLLISAATKLNKDLKSEGFKIVGTVHDSILGEFPEENKDWIVDYIKKIMLHPPILDDFGVELEVPLDVDIGVGPWGTH